MYNQLTLDDLLPDFNDGIEENIGVEPSDEDADHDYVPIEE